jgi:hypothetical protein
LSGNKCELELSGEPQNLFKKGMFQVAPIAANHSLLLNASVYR